MIKDQLSQIYKLFELADRRLVSVTKMQIDGLTPSVIVSLSCCELNLVADAEFDTIQISLTNVQNHPEGSHAVCATGWDKYIGKQLSWAWLTVNYLGYPDGLVLSFGDGMDPHILCIVAGSSINITETHCRKAEKGTP